MALKRPELSVVIPAFNEERRLGPSLDQVLAYLKARRRSFEVLVVDDGSTDGTADLVRSRQRRVPQLKLLSLGRNVGKGGTIKAGVMAAKGKRILFTDADLSTPMEELPNLEKALKPCTPIAIGSRALDRRRIAVRQPLYRELAGRLFNRLVQLVSVPGVRDTQCGFKLFDAKVGQELFALQQIPRFGFDVEFLYLARKAGYGIAEVSVRWVNSPETKVRPIRDGGRAFLDLALIRVLDWKGKYQI